MPSSFPAVDHKASLEQVQVNMDNLKSEAAAAFGSASTVFCCLGTTRGVAGSAEAFLKASFEPA